MSGKPDSEYILDEVQLLRKEIRMYAIVLVATQIPPSPGQTFMAGWSIRMEVARTLIRKETEDLYE